jgi:tRNA G18 (ribose-2'-O)-methylase SpoU
MGTLYRLAAAFGIQHVVCIAPMLEPTHPKVIRSHTGAGFGVSSYRSTRSTEGTLTALSELGWMPLIATGNGTQAYHTYQPNQPWALVLGQEGEGIRLNSQQLEAWHTLSVPMEPTVESLNVATCGAIILSHLYPLSRS